MKIGVDFDNTIVSYDEVFHELAYERGLIPWDFPTSKTQIRDRLRALGQEPVWTELQGLAYGPEIGRATMFPGVRDFFRTWRPSVCIVSHKTRQPYLGAPYDLHAAARGWLAQQGLDTQAIFELTKEAKLQRIASLGCTHFVDDLPEFLGLAEFPSGVTRILFDPFEVHAAPPDVVCLSSWREIQAWFACQPTLASIRS